MSIESAIALRYMRAKRKERFISLITVISIGGVGLGVASLIVVLAVMSGFETNLKDKFLGVTSHIIIKRLSSGISDWPEVLAKIKAVPGVRTAEPFVYGQMLATGPEGPSGVMIKGIDPELAAGEGQLAKIGVSREALDFLKDSRELEQPPIILGRELSYQLRTYRFDQMRVISPFGRVTPLGARAPLTRTYQVVGTFHSGLYDYDSSFAYVSLAEAQKLLGMDDEATIMEVMVEDGDQAAAVRDAIINALDSDEYWGQTWMERNVNLFAALEMEQAAMFVVLTLTILVAAFNIVSTLIMMVKEKTRDIAILKSMGATSRQIRRIFTLQGLTVGVIGASGGLAIGITLCLLLSRYKFIELPADIYMMDSLPVEMRAVHILATVAVTMLISFLATIYPAAQAARLEPVEALRYE